MLADHTLSPGVSGAKPLPGESSNQVTELLIRWRGGDKAALDALMPLVYGELRRIARRHLSAERSDHTLQSTALVHEAYVRLAHQDLPQWHNRAHFFAVAAQLMRQILVDYARSHRAAKRGAGGCKLTLDGASDIPLMTDVDVIALDDALKTLAQMDQEQSRVVELKFFGGLSVRETAEVLSISPSTVERYWMSARAWLFRELDRSAVQ
jgi:RNA polymerase sigma factor (TIGR02999 family)